MQYETLFLSDLHIGSPFFRSTHFKAFIDRISAKKVILNGDIFDIRFILKNSAYLRSHFEAIEALGKMIGRSKETIYLFGNHDIELDVLPGLHPHNIRFVHTYQHTTLLGQKLLVLHGDCFDQALREGMPSWRIETIGKLYQTITVLDAWCYGHLGWSADILGRFKRRSNTWRKYLSRFRTMAIDAAQEHLADGVVCGHIHVPALEIQNGLLYANSGDWAENRTALAEDQYGHLHLLTIEGQHVLSKQNTRSA